MKAKRGTMTPEREDAPEGARPEEEGAREPAPDGGDAPGAAAPEAAAPDATGPEAEIARLRAREEELLRALAEMTNVQRRRKGEAEQAIRSARESLVRDLLPVLDDFERALAAMPVAPDDPVRAGIELVRERMAQILSREGVAPIRPAGQPFDPNLHDAIGERVAPPGVAPGTVLEVALPGYRMGERVLRHAKVVVAGPPAISPTPPSMAGSEPRPPDTIPPPLDEKDR
jgi:molecular chaperone GrpE